MRIRCLFPLLTVIVALATQACGPSHTRGEPPVELAFVQGVWQSPSSGAEHVVRWTGGEFRVVGIVDDDGEVFEVRESQWDGTTLRWTYYVPSTSYLVTFTCEPTGGSEMPCNWFNDHDAAGFMSMAKVR